MQINGQAIGKNYPPYIIAEMSGNHQGSLEKAQLLLRRCAAAGANAFKIQTYTADSLTIDSSREEYIVRDGPWNGRSLYDLYSQGQTPRDWVKPLIELGKELGISVFSSPFGLSDVDFLESLDVPAYKIASFELNFQQLFRRIAQTNKPIIFSTGLATLDEIHAAATILGEVNFHDYAILKCTTSYPAQYEDLNLETIRYLTSKYDVPIGFSDHSVGTVASISAVAMGAEIIEKHVKLDDDDVSVDASFSLPVSELENFINLCRNAKKTIGYVQDGPTDSEVGYLKYRRSIAASRNLASGERIRSEDLTIIRPHIGLDPKFFDSIVGKVTRVKVERGEGITNEMLLD
jgi:pseudaminic acid synthase